MLLPIREIHRKWVMVVGVGILGMVLVCSGCEKEQQRVEADDLESVPFRSEQGLRGAPAAAPGVASAPGQRIHTVQAGETLYGIARKYYGDGSKWQLIYSANRNTLANPTHLKVDQRIVIPELPAEPDHRDKRQSGGRRSDLRP